MKLKFAVNANEKHDKLYNLEINFISISKAMIIVAKN